jgi:sulfate adenylyltransferase subunit 1 (EFTu-like GTPase family)
VRNIAVAVNKMDLTGWSQAKFSALEAEFRAFLKDLDFDEIVFIPVAACSGDNVVTRSYRMAWYCGPTLVEHLEQVQIGSSPRRSAFRMPVQCVNRPHSGFRGYSGLIAERRGAPRYAGANSSLWSVDQGQPNSNSGWRPRSRCLRSGGNPYAGARAGRFPR